MTNPVKPFGTYALPAKREALRLRAGKFGDTKTGRWGISYFRKRAFKGLKDPFDITIMQGVKTRLYPRSSRCEKRAFAGVQVWDIIERDALSAGLNQSASDPFVFFDVGANVGLYSLILAAQAKSLKRATRIIAIEPDPINKARLDFNIDASSADITVLPYAISDTQQDGFLSGGEQNRGEVKLTGGEQSARPVSIKTLTGICSDLNITRIDALKLDIEGHDLKALTHFFETAPKALWPSLLILETKPDEDAPLLVLCTTRGYTITKQAGINTILKRNET